LCEQASQALTRLGLEFRVVDVDADGALRAEFGMLVPVVEVAGDPIFYAGMDPARLGDLVAEAMTRPTDT
jgi:hypothetical protein